jgi:methyl-accepting chemotaxis protein
VEHEERKKVWVHNFQTKLSLRIGAYLVLFLAVLMNFLFAWKLWREGVINPVEQFVAMLQNYLPVIICLLVLVPVMAWDAVRFSHKLVGPLVRFRRTMQDITEGQLVRPIKLRQGDHLLEMRDDFNAMLESLQRRGVPVLKPADPASEELPQRTSA